MVKSKLTKIDDMEKKFEFSDFYSVAKLPISVKCEKNKLKIGLAFNLSRNLSLNSRAEKLYVIGGEKFCYCEDKRLYRIKNGRAVLFNLEKYLSPPEIYKIRYNKKPTLIIKSERGIVFFNGNYGIYDVFDGDNYISIKNRLIICDKDKIYVSGDDPKVKSDYFAIKFPIEDGNILHAFSLNGKLILILKRNIYSLTLFGMPDDYKIEEIESEKLRVMEGTSASGEDECYFISDNKLCILKNGKVCKIDGLLDRNDVTVIGKACIYSGTYLLPVTIDGVKYLYAYDTSDKTDYFIACAGVSFSGGYELSADGKVFKLGLRDGKRGYESETVLGKSGFIGIKRVEVFSSEKADITFISPPNEKTITVTDGEERFYFFGEKVRVKLTFWGADEPLSDLKIFYE